MILRIASRVWESAAAVTVQVFSTTSPPAWPQQHPARKQAPADRAGVGIGGAATEIFDGKCGHG